jgi:hypothetical protein
VENVELTLQVELSDAASSLSETSEKGKYYYGINKERKMSHVVDSCGSSDVVMDFGSSERNGFRRTHPCSSFCFTRIDHYQLAQKQANNKVLTAVL